jgi:hypothetical protein
VCGDFNCGKCGKPGGFCPKNERHQCNICLEGDHAATWHSEGGPAPGAYVAKGAKGDKGKGKGKDKGKGKGKK